MADILHRNYSWLITMYEIIESHPDFIVIYKKPGISFHSESGEPGLFESIKQNEGFKELFPVHRLDKVTSGILVMAKNAVTNLALSNAFANREVEKFYVAISAKKPLKKQGLVKGDMVQARRGAWKLLAENQNPAITQFFNKGLGDGLRLFIVKPHTGKTHQIRVALKSLGAPVLGDELYGGDQLQESADRVYLHALSLGFVLNGESYRFTALPKEGNHFCSINFAAAIAEWREPWLLQWPALKTKKAAL